jgi:thiol-disulfide isomerase/thioredoxin
MLVHRNGWRLAAAAVFILVGQSPAFAQERNPAAGGNPTGGNMYMPSDKLTPTQLKAHIEKMLKVAPPARQAGFGEAMVTAAGLILESKPPESLRAYAALNLLDGLHEWGDVEHNAAADQRLAEEAAKYKSDADKKVATAAALYELEGRVLKPGEIPPADVPKVLDEVKAALTGHTLTAAKYMRLANGSAILINYLGTDEEAEKQFKQLGRLLETSSDPALAKLGTQIKSERRDPKLAVPADKPGDNPAGQAAATPEPEPQPRQETAEQWLDRIEGRLNSFVGSDHDAEFETQKTAFLKDYPNDPLRWRWNLLQARRAVAGIQNPAEATKVAKAALTEVIAAPDATPELHEKAAIMNLQLDMHDRLPVEQLAKNYAEFVQAFPKSTARGVLAEKIIELAAGNDISEQALARLQKLKDSSDGLLAMILSVKISEMQKLLALKTTPMDLKFTDAAGKEFDLESYRGKVVLVDFWATWCGPCVAGLPEVIDQYKKYHDKGFEIVGISFDEDKNALDQFVKDRDMTWVQFFDGKGWGNKYGQEYAIHSIPRMWLIGRDGKVIDFNARTNLPQKISQLMQGKDGAGEAKSNPAGTPRG